MRKTIYTSTTRNSILLLTCFVYALPLVSHHEARAAEPAAQSGQMNSAADGDASMQPGGDDIDQDKSAKAGPPIDPMVVRKDLEPIFKLEVPQLDKRTPSNKLLTGGVEHPEMLPAAPKFLQGGVDYDSSAAQKLEMHDTWYRLPAWLAGRWESAGALLAYTANFRNGHVSYPNRPLHGKGYDYAGLQTLGWQQDAKGEYWQFERFKGTKDLDRNLTDEKIGMQMVKLMLSYEPAIATADKLTMKSIYTWTTVDPQTKKVVSTKLFHAIHEFRQLADNKILVDTSLKQFNEHGEAVDVQEIQLIKKRVAPYTPIAFFKGKDLKESLRQYLESHGLSELDVHSDGRTRD